MQNKWMLQILVMEGANLWLLEAFFNVVVQVVILFVFEMCVMTSRMFQALGGFQHKLSHRLTVKQLWRCHYGRWEYYPLEE